ncbi:CPBP family intramembrane glutamic endopeptidase [Cellulomonas dongxiuzhuiae]|uniref:CPBP family intramembrane metalloprotease n=1 Tax=Cellulomonas dongxiuzhuiae TaxID=2819979 RepID=A0ABX8GMZ6_9CELL|nr:CPBP family intramembrane glutamic endopeptidase [Cellulomonas dongxiuzhuiae]MBO3095887.1 CPBP family intramembrane metalloprotease [Cellulomonas dongxiuzhuiae]QWC17188.1 CPBP family intramembrane metalloprotease [Cellulomonas dongxiuzhuiae]
MRFLGQLLAVVAAWAIGGTLATAVADQWTLQLVLGLAAAALALGTYAWVVRRTERRSPVDLPLTGAIRPLVRGTAGGMLLFVAVIGIIAALGAYRVEGWGSVTTALALLGLAAAASATEEVVFRGVLLRHLESRTGTWGALAVTSVLFGAVHLTNPAATAWGATAITIEAGLMLGAAYVATRSLWLPIGLHMGWNFAAAGIFGTEVSGNDTATGLLDGVTSGPTLLSGGAFGPEASIVAVTAGLVLTIVLMRVAHRRGHIVPLPRRADRRTADRVTTDQAAPTTLSS